MQILKKLSNKKVRYIIYSLAMMGLLLWVDRSLSTVGHGGTALLILFSVCFLGGFFTQYPSISDYKGMLTLIPPLGLALGSYFTLLHFPNFSLYFKLLGLLVVGVMFYLMSLVNNIFLVVEEKEDLIPLYRVAVTWSQVLLVVIAIPLYTGAYKLNFNPILQTLLAVLFTFLFTLYFFWYLSLDLRTRRVDFVEVLVNCLFSLFLVGATNLALSFIPTVSFLRALFSASIFLFALNYLDGYMKNRITLKLIYQQALISIISLFIVLGFSP